MMDDTGGEENGEGWDDTECLTFPHGAWLLAAWPASLSSRIQVGTVIIIISSSSSSPLRLSLAAEPLAAFGLLGQGLAGMVGLSV